MIQIGILGLGTVGTGVVKVIEANGEPIRRKLREDLKVKRALVRTFRQPYRQIMTDDFAEIENDPDIRVVVETMGGIDPAFEYTSRCLRAGKHVVTANKKLVAERGHELLKIAKEHGVNYLFEASVGGGIPILHPLTQCLAANRVDEICGILNGTTNYILTKMRREGTPFAEALRQAQEKGYAEADPTADVKGFDAAHKICILADLAFGRRIDPQDIPIEGITRISTVDMRIVEESGFRIKLLGRCLRMGDERTAYVSPHLVPKGHPLASVDDVFNAVMVRGNATGDVMFYGRGAGELPTASACVSDVLECLQASPARPEICWDADTGGYVRPESLPVRWYFRVEGDPSPVFGNVMELAPGTFLTEPRPETAIAALRERPEVRACMRVLG